ncbi:MAG TPA: family 20 glycosylhydrolase [Candidatus Sumerlaeota bacterium]|nr:family 20 glycosylhydrolase [Candidatus Sumerlaeota bacterium]HPK04031.1 family 20 glycosylhydrolase [Candidatus Sumerlaeota bacterium]
MNRTTLGVLLLMVGTLGHAAPAPGSPGPIELIPRPARLERQPGSFVFSPGTRILAESGSAAARVAAQRLADLLRRAAGLELDVAESDAAEPVGGALLLTTRGARADLGPEGYELIVRPESIVIRAPGAAGLFHGAQSLRQLLPAAIESPRPVAGPFEWSVPGLVIEDRPRFAWRGFLFDVGRHYYPREFIKRLIDLMAYYKVNTLHWHLTDDQGWRIEIRRYPRLTEVGAWRAAAAPDSRRLGDGSAHGGFYTQDDIREIVDHARARGVTIVPEIEMPGHALAALAAYPELSCTGGPFQVATEWGIYSDLFCAGNEAVFEFLEGVLTEVTELFPGEYVHIGGDEAPKDRWRTCPRCQARIRSEGLADENALQGYFSGRINRILAARGRKLVGWEEVIDGGFVPGATAMAWHLEGGDARAARAGHDVVMTPHLFTYLDYRESQLAGEPSPRGWLPLRKLYEFEPVGKGLTREQAAHILGAQCCLWTEFFHAEAQVEHALLPRLSALAELTWSPAERKDWADYQARLAGHLRRLELGGVRFRIPTPEVAEIRAEGPRRRVSVALPFDGAHVGYTLDGREPTFDSPRWRGPIELETSATLKLRTFLPGGRGSQVVEAHIP